jgi:phenylacetate-CoA ligase
MGEFAVDVYRRGELDEMEVRVEIQGSEPESVAVAIAREIRNALSLRVDVKPVPYGTLPRFDLSARRFTDHRRQDSTLG